ncbi:MAG: hypothetical protein KGM43_16425 [Planctomycetota bacterium]|nr:hypothetical protein [Planctomycetota bacterium]
MTRVIPESHPLHRMFRGLTEFTFTTELGIGDPTLLGYVSDLLARFVSTASVWRIRDEDGRRITEVARMLAEAEASADASRRRDCHRQIGDFTLFWTGVYPEALGRMRRSNSADQLVDYQRQGKKSYYLASTLDEDAESAVLRRLSEEFELCAFGLARVRQEWERYESEAPRGANPAGPAF